MPAQVLPFRSMAKNLDRYPNRIRELRKARGLSQQALADRIGTSDVHVGYLELGRRELNLTMMRAIARELGVTTAEILAEDDNPLASTPRSQRLLRHWVDSDEPGRQSIERVAETMAGYRAETASDSLPRIAPADPDTANAPARKQGGKS